MNSTGLRFLDPGDIARRQAWDAAVAQFAGGTVFHTTAWLDVIGKGLGLSPRFAYRPGPNGSIRALVPLFQAGGWARSVRWINLPQSCASDPLACDEEAATELLVELARAAAANGASAVVLRTARRLHPALPADWEARREDVLLRHVIEFDGARDIRSLPRIQRRQREKFQSTQKCLTQRGIRPRLAGPEEASRFARAMHDISLRRHGYLALPPRFFEALLAFLPDAARLATIGAPEGPVLGYTLTIWHRGCSDFLYGSGLPSREGRDAYRVCLGTEIDAAIRAGLSRFDFHETGPGQEGLVTSKARWGAQRVDGSYLVLASAGGASGLRIAGRGLALAAHVFRHVPVWLSLKISGPIHRALQ